MNNVLTPERIVKLTPATVGIMSGVTPTSTTVELAKDVPLEKAPLEQNGSSDLPGSFPETPGVTEKADFSVNPIPAQGQVSITSGVYDDPELVAADKEASEQIVGVSPLPAFPGAVNPIKLAPGEKVPDPNTLTGNTINTAVRTDKESYEKSDFAGALDLPPVSKNMIPESSLPIGESTAVPTIQSVGPQSTTSQLAADVPLESSKVPEVVKKSQEEAGFDPEASAVPEEVKEKSAVEKELLSEVPVAPSTSEGTGGAAAEEISAKDTPELVKESIAESGQNPEAAAYEEPVLEKAAVEKELLAEVKPDNSAGEPAPTIEPKGLSPPTQESHDVTLPESQTEAQGQPTTTSGVASGTTDVTTGPETPIKDTPGSSKISDSPASSAKAEKKKKRTSFFGKLKAKFSDKASA